MNTFNPPCPGRLRHCLAAFAAFVMMSHAQAQSAIDWLTLDAGGGVQSSANYVVNFTAGQTDVGSTAPSSANYQITPGFWALEDMGPATGLPELNIMLKGGNVVLSWPSPSTGFQLQHTDSLEVIPASWVTPLILVSDDGFNRSVSVPPDQLKRFYRLRRP